MNASKQSSILKYKPGNFHIIELRDAGVVCAVTGAWIPLDDLQYWDVERQIAFQNPQAVAQDRAQQQIINPTNDSTIKPSQD